MPRTLASAFVKVRPDLARFREESQAGVKAALARLDTNVSLSMDTGKVKAKLADLQAKLGPVFADIEKTRALKVDDKQLQYSLARAELRADKLNAKLASGKLSVDGVRKTEIELLGVLATVDRIKEKASSGGGGSGGIFGALSGAIEKLGGLSTSIGPVVINPITVALGGLAAIMSGPLLAALLPITIGFGAFAVVAGSVVSDLHKALGTLSTATDNYAQASLNLNQAIHQSPADMKAYRESLSGLEPDLRNAAKLLTDQGVRWQDLSPSMQKSVIALANNKLALKGLLPDQKAALTALVNQKAAWDDLSPSQQKMSKQLGDLGGQFGKLKAAVQPQVLAIFGQGLRIIKDLMPALKPLLIAAANAAKQFLTNIANWLESPSGKKFLNWLSTQGPKDIKIFGAVMWTLAQIVGRVFSFLNNAGNTWWKNVTHLFHDVKQLFTVDVPGWMRILKDDAKIIWDKMRIDALTFVSRTIGIFAKLPGPLGAPFRAARRSISAELGNLLGDVRRNEGDVQRTWDRLHGKSVALTFGLNLPAGVSYPSRHIKGRGAKGIKGASAGTWLVGEEGPELAYLPQGTHVMPAGATKKVMGGLAGGTGWNIHDVIHPSAGTFNRRLADTFAAAEAAVISSVRKTAQLSAAFTGAGIGGSGVTRWAPLILRALAMLGLSSSNLGAVEHRMNQESGGNPFAINLTDSNAAAGDPSRGLMQTIGSTFEHYRSWALPNNIYNPLANIYAGLNYAEHAYPGRSLSSVMLQPGGYDSGGYLPTGLSMAYNGTGQPERVLSGKEPLNVTITVDAGSNSAYTQFLAGEIKKYVRVSGGGQVQTAFGSV